MNRNLKDKSKSIALAAAINGGLLTVSILRSAYDGKGAKDDQVQTREWPLFEPLAATDEPPKRHWDPITGNIFSWVALIVTKLPQP